jgi:predicted DNA-binding transcriptional regulator AlpA
MRPQSVTLTELAERLNYHRDVLRKKLKRMMLPTADGGDGFPQPLTATGAFRWDRASVEAWFSRHHPFAPPQPANDYLPTPIAPTDAAQRAELAAIYGRP